MDAAKNNLKEMKLMVVGIKRCESEIPPCVVMKAVSEQGKRSSGRETSVESDIQGSCEIQ